MSSNRMTAGELIRRLQKFPPTMCVAVLNIDEGNWQGECFADGPIEGMDPLVVRMWEIRSGWDLPERQGHMKDHADDCECGCEPIIILSDMCHSLEDLRECREPEGDA